MHTNVQISSMDFELELKHEEKNINTTNTTKDEGITHFRINQNAKKPLLPLKFMVDELGYSPCKCEEYKETDPENSEKYTNTISNTRQFIECVTCKTPYKFRYPWISKSTAFVFNWGPSTMTVGTIFAISKFIAPYNYGVLKGTGAVMGLFWVVCFVPFGVLSTMEYIRQLYRGKGFYLSSRNFVKNTIFSFLMAPVSIKIMCAIPSLSIIGWNRPLPYTSD